MTSAVKEEAYLRLARFGRAGFSCWAASWRTLMVRSSASSARNSNATLLRGQPVATCNEGCGQFARVLLHPAC